MASGLRNLRKDRREKPAKKRKNKEDKSRFYADQNVVENNLTLENNSEQEQEIGSPKRETEEDMTSTNNDFDFVKYNIVNLFRSFRFLLQFKPKDFYTMAIKSLKGIKLFFTYGKTSEQIKARNFEIPMSYGFQITNYALSIEDYYNIGDEIVVFNTKEELLKLCRYFIREKKLRKKILHRSYVRSMEHTYVDRFKTIINQINKL